MKNILRILPVALALLTTPVVVPRAVERAEHVVARITCRAVVTEVEYHEPRVAGEIPVVVVRVETPARIPLRGASTPRAPAV